MCAAFFKRMQFFAGLEADSLAGSNADFSAGAGISTDSGLACANAEHTEATQFNALTGCERLFEAFKDSVNGGFGFGARQSGALDHLVNDILFDQ